MFDHTEEHIDTGLIQLQANIDDMNPELCPPIIDKLLELGANDAFWVPIVMKKGRPGMMLNVLVDEQRLDAVKTLIFTETTTLGIRYTPMHCHRLARSVEKVETVWGPVAVKVGFHKGKEVGFAPEFSDCEKIARQYHLPLKQVYDVVIQAYQQQFH